MTEKMSARMYRQQNVILTELRKDLPGIKNDVRHLKPENLVQTVPTISINDDLDLWFECLKNGYRPLQYLDTLFLNTMLTIKEKKQLACADNKFWNTLLSNKVIPSQSMQFVRKHPTDNIYCEAEPDIDTTENIIQCTCWRYSTMLKSE